MDYIKLYSLSYLYNNNYKAFAIAYNTYIKYYKLDITDIAFIRYATQEGYKATSSGKLYKEL